MVSLAATASSVTSCAVARLELAATLHRHRRENRLTQEQAQATWQKFEMDEQMGAWEWTPVTQGLIRAACTKTRQLPASVFLRSADALHLTSAREQGFTEVYTNDRHMLAAAPYFDLRAVNILP